MSLLKIQKNVLFGEIVSKGLNPSQFTIDSNALATTISFKNSTYLFQVSSDISGNIDRIDYSPAENNLVSSIRIKGNRWTAVLSNFRFWLDYLLREIEQPDKWNDLLESSKQVHWHIEEEQNTRFTSQEVLDIESSVKQIKSKMESLGLLPEQLQLIEARLDYLCDKAKSFNRIDWKNILVGTLISLVVELALPQETAKTLWHIFGDAFKHVISIFLR